MAQKVQVIVTCDLHEDETEGVETVGFGFDGSDYEIDLCAEHSEEVQNQLQALISCSRRAEGSRGRRRSTASRAEHSRKAKPAAGPTSDRERLQAIREWARAHGHSDVKSRGRIPQAIIEEYEAAQEE